MKVCVFIFAVFKKDIICRLIEIPEKEIIPEHSEIDIGETTFESSFAPRVTSKMP